MPSRSDDGINGFIVLGIGSFTSDWVKIFDTSTSQTTVSSLQPGSMYIICVFAYKDLLSVPNITTVQLPNASSMIKTITGIIYPVSYSSVAEAQSTFLSSTIPTSTCAKIFAMPTTTNSN